MVVWMDSRGRPQTTPLFLGSPCSVNTLAAVLVMWHQPWGGSVERPHGTTLTEWLREHLQLGISGFFGCGKQADLGLLRYKGKPLVGPGFAGRAAPGSFNTKDCRRNL